MDRAKRLNKILVALFNNVLKLEEAVLKQSEIQNLSITEMHTLEAIGEGKPKTMTQVATGLKINVSTLTAAINKLVTKGYVARFRIPEDRRMVKLELTQAGIRAIRQHEEFHLAMINDALSQLSSDETEKFIQSLDRVNEFMLTRRMGMPEKREIKLTPDRIYQGGMSVGISMCQLASAVAICGGVGVIAAYQIGFMEPDFAENPLEANKRALRYQIRKARAKVRRAKGKGLIGVNIMCNMSHYEEYVRTAIEAGAQVIVSGGGVPTALPGICKGSNVKLVPVVSSARAASVIIRNWAKKHNRMPDALIFEGPLAGGHLGYKEEQLEPAEERFYKTISEIKGEIESFPHCLLIVAGGIYTKQDAQKALAWGADGVQLGSRFVTTEECDAPLILKQAYLKCKETDTRIIRSVAGVPARVMSNQFAADLQEKPVPIVSCDGCLTTCDREKAWFCMKDAAIQAARGDMEKGLVFCGGKGYKAHKIETVQAIFQELTCQ